MEKLISRVTIFAVGVSEYEDQSLNNLSGPLSDLHDLRALLVENNKTALFDKNQFVELINPDSDELRFHLNNYLLSRSAEGDILLFYFSGHGVAIGRDDFGFCTTDTLIHPDKRFTLPLSIVKFSEIIQSLYLSNIIPVMIIDACYSGNAGMALDIPPIEAISAMQHQTHLVAAGSYALLCSCSGTQVTSDTTNGGVFTQLLIDCAKGGIESGDNNKWALSLLDLFPMIEKGCLSLSDNTTPRLFIGVTLPKFPFVKNTKHKIHKYSLSPTYLNILDKLWNEGNPVSLSPSQIGEYCGNGAYCNHNKLSFAPWALVETDPDTNYRKLSPRGHEFMLNTLRVPKTIIEDPATSEILPNQGTIFSTYSEMRMG